MERSLFATIIMFLLLPWMLVACPPCWSDGPKPLPPERAKEMHDLFDLEERADRVINYEIFGIELLPKTKRVGLIRSMLSKTHYRNTPTGLRSLKRKLRHDKCKELIVIRFSKGMLSFLDRSNGVSEAVTNVRSTFSDLGYKRILIVGHYATASNRFYDSARDVPRPRPSPAINRCDRTQSE